MYIDGLTGKKDMERHNTRQSAAKCFLFTFEQHCELTNAQDLFVCYCLRCVYDLSLPVVCTEFILGCLLHGLLFKHGLS